MEMILIVAGAYLVGAIPAGVIAGKVFFGKDVRRFGSGNIGFTNVARVFGWPAASIVLAADVLKGAAAVAGGAWWLTGRFAFPVEPSATAAWGVVLAAAAVLAGNMFSVFIGFSGGKGVGVGAGIVAAMAPEIAGILLAVWLAMVIVFRYVSLASITIALLFPLLILGRYSSVGPYVGLAVVASVLVVFGHRANIKRLVTGTEARLERQAGAEDE